MTRPTAGRSSSTRSRSTNGRVPIFAGVIDPTTDRVIGHARIARSAGADAVVVTAPFYARTSQPEIVDHFRYITRRGRHPGDRLRHPGLRPCQARAPDHRRRSPARALSPASRIPAATTAIFRYVLARHRRPAGLLRDDRLRDRRRQRACHGRARRRAGPRQCRPARLRQAVEPAARPVDWAGARQEQERLCRLFEIVWISPGAHQRRLGRASARSRPRCAASASSPPTSWRGRSAA